ncbi:unnamed protein product [Hymenolepis diminuta]|uniref:Uncharacterized protein n=1 Tax=Hymenolepis diminuta TaxID=6216 RepID=A0A3P7A1I4_HYMDI|nr:unnamed protein product [Hymenolepis diminuta]
MEAVDRHNAQLICPATIGEVSGQHVLVSFDGWSGNFDYWTRYDSRDLFPVGWCKLAGHALQSPGPAAVQRLNLTPTKMPTAPPKQTDLSSSAGGMASPQPLQSSASLPSLISPPPPLPRLTVITTTREDGSPQTIIKTTTTGDSTRSTPTYGSETKTSVLNNGSGSSYPILVPKPSGDTDGGESVERKHKKSKKHKRRASKESHRRHTGEGEFLHQSVSLHNSAKPPKLVIRNRSGDFSSTQTSELFVDTMDSSPPPLSAPFSTKFSSTPHSLGDSPGNGNPNNNLNKNCDSQSIFPTSEQPRGQMASHSTVSPASMDLGPCPLPNVQEWSTDDVYNYLVLKDSSLVDVANLFKQQEIDGPALLLVDMDTMRNLLNMKIGPALKVDDILSRLKRGHL